MRRAIRPLDVCHLMAAATLAVLTTASARATTYLITTTADDAVNNGNCTLREAIRSAETNAAHDNCAAGNATDVITLPTGAYPFAGGESFFGGGALTIQSQTLNPFDVSIDLASAGRFIHFSGSGTFVLEGLEIKNGLAPAGEDVGGAVRATEVSLRISRFRFLSNQASREGGALFYFATQPGRTLSANNGAFLSNSVTGTLTNASTGGAVRTLALGGTTVSLRDVAFLGNSAIGTDLPVLGGALLLESASSTSSGECIRCTFGNNSTVLSASSSNYSEGGAMYAKAAGGKVLVSDCRFTGNSATGPATSTKVPVLLAEASSGGSVVLDRLFVDFNGGVQDTHTHDVFLFTNDVTGAISLYDSQITFGVAAGLLVDSHGTAQLGHLTIADYPLRGAALDAVGSGVITLQNSIAAFNGTDLVSSGTVNLTTNFVGGDPLFVNQPVGDYHLSVASSAIGGGTNGAATVRFADLDHRARIVDGQTEMGAYEFDGVFADNFEVGDAGSWSLITP